MTGKKRKRIAHTDEVDQEILHQLKGLDNPQKEVDEEDLYSQSVMTSEQRAMAKIKKSKFFMKYSTVSLRLLF